MTMLMLLQTEREATASAESDSTLLSQHPTHSFFRFGHRRQVASVSRRIRKVRSLSPPQGLLSLKRRLDASHRAMPEANGKQTHVRKSGLQSCASQTQNILPFRCSKHLRKHFNSLRQVILLDLQRLHRRKEVLPEGSALLFGLMSGQGFMVHGFGAQYRYVNIYIYICALIYF